MLTLFTTPKPFTGHSGIIQRNALKSWTLLRPDVEVILFGDDQGAAEVSRELGIRHVAEVERTPEGPKYLRSFFGPAQRMARHDVLCYVNCDIILTSDFLDAVSNALAVRRRFLMVGRRWDTDIAKPLDFGDAAWPERVRELARQTNQLRTGDWIDYFVFPRGLYEENLPNFVIGRVFWDNWLVWKARSAGLSVVDASEAVMAIHQNHDYGYHAGGRKGVWGDELAMRNLALAGGRWQLCTIDDASHLLGPDGLHENPRRRTQALQRFARTAQQGLWTGALDWTRPLRRALGLRKKDAEVSPADGQSRSPERRLL
jgi:hypothetical protein